jgi:hypothetical protein
MSVQRSALRAKADMPQNDRDVRIWPKADMPRGPDERLLLGEERKCAGCFTASVFDPNRPVRSLAMGAATRMSSRPEDFHLRALPEPYVNLSIHTAPDVRPLP